MKENKFGYEGEEKFRPLSAWAYFGYSLLFCLPVVGLISLIVCSFSDKNINRRSFARSFWIALLFAIIIYAIIFAIFAATGNLDQFKEIWEQSIPALQ